MKMPSLKPLLIPLTAITAGSAFVSYKLFNFAFKRVDYVPETSKEKQKYADKYYEYVDWFHSVPSEDWYLNEDNPDQKMVATTFQPKQPPKKRWLSLMDTRAIGKPWPTMPRCSAVWATMS